MKLNDYIERAMEETNEGTNNKYLTEKSSTGLVEDKLKSAVYHIQTAEDIISNRKFLTATGKKDPKQIKGVEKNIKLAEAELKKAKQFMVAVSLEK
jgi:hypothetical protein